MFYWQMTKPRNQDQARVPPRAGDPEDRSYWPQINGVAFDTRDVGHRDRLFRFFNPPTAPILRIHYAAQNSGSWSIDDPDASPTE